MTFSIETSVLAAAAFSGLAVCLALLTDVLGPKAARAAGTALGFGRLSSALPSWAGVGRKLSSLRERGAAPAQLGPYVLVEKIGEGAMGQVYRARHSSSGAWRAVKVLSRGASARDRLRFENEAALGATVRHESAVAIYERGEAPDGTLYYAMELVEGVSLQRLVEREGALSPARAVRMGAELCAALSELHRMGLVHRDVKPDNVLVYRAEDGSERVKLIDFGLIQRASSAGGAGDVVGTPLYLSPEAITAPEAVGARSDLYSLGAALYFVLSGAPVFEGRSVVEVCCQHLYSEPARFDSGEISRELERVVLDCLAKNPAARPASAEELAARLARCSERGRGARVARLMPRRAALELECAAAA